MIMMVSNLDRKRKMPVNNNNNNKKVPTPLQSPSLLLNWTNEEDNDDVTVTASKSPTIKMPVSTTTTSTTTTSANPLRIKSRCKKRLKKGELLKSVEKTLTPAYPPTEKAQTVTFDLSGGHGHDILTMGIHQQIDIFYDIPLIVQQQRSPKSSPKKLNKKQKLFCFTTGTTGRNSCNSPSLMTVITEGITDSNCSITSTSSRSSPDLKLFSDPSGNDYNFKNHSSTITPFSTLIKNNHNNNNNNNNDSRSNSPTISPSKMINNRRISGRTAKRLEENGEIKTPIKIQVPTTTSTNSTTTTTTTTTTINCNSILTTPKTSNKRPKNTPKCTTSCTTTTSTGTSTSKKFKMPEPVFKILDLDSTLPESPLPKTYLKFNGEFGAIDYDLDDEDVIWLSIQNELRRRGKGRMIKEETMQFALDKFEKESHFEKVASRRELEGLDFSDESTNCYICLEGESSEINQIVFCDLCSLAVHQECYGVPYIPEGDWLCSVCFKSPSKEVRCSLCPIRGGALKKTEDGNWAHILCALAIPEIFFANPAFLEPFLGLKGIPAKRYKLKCSICHERSGACIQCQSDKCQTAFHAVCAQEAGLGRIAKSGDFGTYLTHFEAICQDHRTSLAFHDFRVPMTLKRRGRPFKLVPKLADDKFKKIIQEISLTVPKSSPFLKKLKKFWLIKRHARHGVPLIPHTRHLELKQASNQLIKKEK